MPFLIESDIRQAKEINSAVAQALREETGRPYRGVLYGGFMATANGVKLLEYNARFADPESMNILPILDGDFLDLSEAVVRGQLDTVPASFRPYATVCKYVVPRGYPTSPVRGESIVIPEELYGRDALEVYFAAVNDRDGDVLLTGSRAVAFVGIGETLQEAENLAELGASSVQGPAMHRRDIGTQELVDARVRHMAMLRGGLSEGSSRSPVPALV